jgi:hypothetical protein
MINFRMARWQNEGFIVILFSTAVRLSKALLDILILLPTIGR